MTSPPNPTPGPLHHSLALDGALLRTVDATGRGEALRLWEAAAPAVVLGHSGRLDRDVRAAACSADGVPIVRRLTGGGAVVLAPGCLNFTLALCLEGRPELSDVSRSYERILGAVVGALGIPGLAHRGLSDLAVGDRKVSGNAQRRGRRALLHQGTLLYACDLGLFARYLREPSRQPAYRAGRSHDAFVANLSLGAGDLRERLAAAFARPPWGLPVWTPGLPSSGKGAPGSVELGGNAVAGARQPCDGPTPASPRK